MREVDRQCHRTPPSIFNPLHDCFSFSLDAAADSNNTLLPRFCGKGSDISEDGLACSWAGERVFVNPPFGNLYDWIKKAYSETRKLCDLAVVISRIGVSTKYWPIIEQADTVLMFQPRIQFIPATKDIKFSSNSQECCLVIFRRYPSVVRQRARFLTWEWRERGRKKT